MVTDLLRSRPAPGAGGGDLLPNYWNPSRGQPETILPTNYIPVVGTAGNNAWGSYVTLTAGLPDSLVLLSAHITQCVAASSEFWYELRATLIDGYHTIATFGLQSIIAGSGSSPMVSRPFRLEPYTMPPGAILEIRAYGAIPAPTNTQFYAFVSGIPWKTLASWYDPWPNTYIAGTRATNQRRSIAVPNYHSIGAAWTQILAAAPNDMLITAAELNGLEGKGSAGQVMEIGTGAAGAEVAHTRVPFPRMPIIAFTFGHQEPGRKGLVLNGERVVARMLSGTTPRNGAVYFEDIT
jgi:hypothetical protein